MRKAMRHQSGSPPLHVHISDTTPVHVHLKSQRARARTDRVILHPTAPVQTRGTRIPLGKSPSRRTSYTWEGPTHCLEIIPPLTEPEPHHSALRLSELTSEEDEGLQGRTHSLMTEVARRKKQHLLHQQREQLNTSRQAMVDQEEQQAEVTQEQNTQLRRPTEKVLEESSRAGGSLQDGDALLQKLEEAEADGAAAALEVSALREAVSRLSASGRNKCSGCTALGLAEQTELLLQKLKTFESRNQALRRLLREQQESQTESIRLSEQNREMLQRLNDTEAENAHLLVKLEEKNQEVHQLSGLVDAEKEHARSSADLSRSLESTRARLQGRLRSREAENNRLSVQIKNQERAASQQQAEMAHLTEQLMRLKGEAATEREALKRATGTQKHRAERSEDAAGRLSAQLLQMEKQVAEAMSAAEVWKRRHGDQMKEKSQLELEVSALNSRISDLMEELQTVEDKVQLNRGELFNHLHELTSENTAAKLENQSLKATASALEDKMSTSQSELQQVKVSVRQYEDLLDSYKTQVERTRAEVEEYRSRLAQAEWEAQAVRGELDQEVLEVRRELLGRLSELELLPEALRHSELQLQEVQDRERSQERRNTELITTLTDLRLKMENQENQMDLIRQKNKMLMEENRHLQERVETLGRKLEAASSQNSDLLTLVAKREKMVHNNQLSLEEKNRECSLLSQKLEEALDDARLQMSETREHSATKERSAQSRVLELEIQLSRTTSEIEKIKRSREEVENRYQSRLQDLKDRLEQSDSTNRSLQNYVQFLKASYANVFGEVALSSALRVPSPI
ncbi:outer dense fiber protein 2 isoform X1 [Nothobranchius furzeri]|uniref:outer dense fiber protein 2 isoform X1 n=1 Tax=Nothobranchius furzeri TaxID=105023 RepID=UPI003904E01D